MNRAKLAKVLFVIVPANASLSALAWAVVTHHVVSPSGFEVVPMGLSVPGWFFAIAIWGYNSGESALSDALIVTTNTIIYSMMEILLLRVGQAVCRRLSKQRTGA